MYERELIRSGVSPLDVLETYEQLGIVAHRAHDRDEAADVLGMSPPCVVPAAIGMRHESRRHGHGVILRSRALGLSERAVCAGA